jgi:hypothetical protein
MSALLTPFQVLIGSETALLYGRGKAVAPGKLTDAAHLRKKAVQPSALSTETDR